MKKNDLKNIKFFFNAYSQKFDEIYDTKTGTSSFFRIIVNMIFRKAMRTRYILALSVVKKIKKKLCIIDIGCGPGRYAHDLAKLGHYVTAIDISNDMISIAKKKNLIFKKKINFIVGDYLLRKFAKKFDYAILNGFFDYVKEPDLVFKKLKKDCKFFAASFPKLYHWLTPQRKIRYVLKNCPLYFYSKRKIEMKLEMAGIKKYKILDNGREYFVVGYCSK